jgi:glucokinase
MNLVGIDLGGTNLRAGLLKDGRLLRVAAVALCSNSSQNEILDQIQDLIGGFADIGIDGIGIGVPSIVDVDRGIVYDVQNIPSWREVPLKDHLESRFTVPVYVNNDANCFAVGEKVFGKGKDYQNMVGLIIGTGLGAGLIINNKLYAGRNCGAGEFGMIPWKEGILEDYCSGQFFKTTCNSPGEQLFHEALQGNIRAKEVFAEFGRNLGNAIGIILLTIDPEIVILGGSVSKSFAFFRDAMWDSLSSFPYPRTLRQLRIEVSEVDNVAILGAAALLYDAFGK